MSVSEEIKVRREFKTITLTSSTGKPLATLACYVLDDTLAIHPPIFPNNIIPEWLATPQYVISHVDSGLAIGYTLLGLDRVQDMAEDLINRFDLYDKTARQLRRFITLKQEIQRMRSFGALHRRPVSKDLKVLIDHAGGFGEVQEPEQLGREKSLLEDY